MRPLSIVTTSWDDGDPKDLKIAELLWARQLRGTFYVPNIGYLGKKVLTAKDLQSLCEEGFEIGGHSVSHISLPGLPAERLKHEVGRCKEKLQQIINNPVIMFCYPYGHYTRPVLREVQNQGYVGARTVSMLATAPEFLAFEMPTTLQAYPHPPLTYLRNLGKNRNVSGVWAYLTRFRRSKTWVELGKQLFREVFENGGIWHLYGHSWEIEELNLWDDLRELLDYVCHRPLVKYVNNGQLVQRANPNLINDETELPAISSK